MNIVERSNDTLLRDTPREIHVELDARETAWEIAPGLTVSARGYQGLVPGPTIVAHVGDTIVARL